MEKEKMKQDTQWDSKSVNDYTSLEKIKKQMRKNNWAYIQRHPEIRAIIRVLLHELINKQPENIYEFAATLFNCNNTPLLITKINKQLKYINEQLKKGTYCQFDADFLFNEQDSTHSLLSTNSVRNDIDSMLRYAVILRNRNDD